MQCPALLGFTQTLSHGNGHPVIDIDDSPHKLFHRIPTNKIQLAVRDESSPPPANLFLPDTPTALLVFVRGTRRTPLLTHKHKRLMELQSPTSTVQTGVAGRTNYAQWDKLATDLVEQVETEEKQEAEQESSKVSVIRLSFFFYGVSFFFAPHGLNQ